ncbi:MAG: hypothetical protein COA73_03175 [Candidatus Hydrogenedentota bacterium]|nr:MAG: hypothetical protein COA73_03175 [Candidatus Hydrogenedentota bacterium]
MNESTLEQARFLNKTIKSLQNKLLRRFGPITITCNDLDIELTFAQLSTMAVVRDMGSVSLKELANAMQIAAPTASCMVDKLVELGAVTREPSKRDRREICVGLTATGLFAVNSMENQMLQALGDTLEAIGPEYASQMVDIYKRIEETMNLEQPTTTINSQIS